MPVYSGTLSPAQIAQYAYSAGFRGSSLVTAIAVALAESSGKVNALGDQTLTDSKWGYSIGLWQVRSLRGQYGTGAVRDATKLRNPAFNAASAFRISSGGSNFSPWTAYTSGAYKKYLSAAQAAAANFGGGDAMVAAGGDWGGVGDLGYQGFNAASAAEMAKTLYGYLGWYIDHPEVGPTILRAAEQGWDSERLRGELSKTNWWRTTAETARQWDALLVMDPATAERRLKETGLSIKLAADKFGVLMPPDLLTKLSHNALRFGWNPAEIQLALISQTKWNNLAPFTQGALGKLMADVQRLAADYMVPVTTKQAWQWARRIAGGASTIENVQAKLAILASTKFPHLGDEIARGTAPSQIFAPHRNVIAQTLEISPDDIDFLGDRTWAPVTSFKDPSSGKTRQMTLAEAARYARSRPEWARTGNAWDSVTQAGDAVLQIFGKVAA